MKYKWNCRNLIGRRGGPEDETLGEASPVNGWPAGVVIGAGSDGQQEKREDKATWHHQCS
jgi:hypothetical protein